MCRYPEPTLPGRPPSQGRRRSRRFLVAGRTAAAFLAFGYPFRPTEMPLARTQDIVPAEGQRSGLNTPSEIALLRVRHRLSSKRRVLPAFLEPHQLSAVQAHRWL